MTNNHITAHSGLHMPIYLERMKDAPDKVNLQENYRMQGAFERIDDVIAAIGLKPLRAWPMYHDHALVEFEGFNFVEFSRRGKVYMAEVFGDRPFRDRVRALRQIGYVPNVDWTFTNHKGEHTTASLPLGDADTVHDAYYPFLRDGVKAFMDGYLNSNASILVLAGEPGTGKTSLIRHMISTHERKTVITHDEAVMGSDMFYVDYMVNEDRDLMVIEDADVLLRSRASDQNRTMAKLLNASNGLVRLIHKKIIFTTNQSNLREIDPALVRPGRCYGVVHFRALTPEEAVAAAKAAGVQLSPGSGERTLSEVFNGKARGNLRGITNGLRFEPAVGM